MQNCIDNREAPELKICNICAGKKQKKEFPSKGRVCNKCIAEKERMKKMSIGDNWYKMFIG